MHRRSIAVVALLLSVASAQRALWVVDPANGPGTHFVDLQQAADDPRVAAGDVLSLRDGVYPSLRTDKPLCVFGTPNSWLRHVHVSDIPAGAEFVIHGGLVTFELSQLATLEFWSCAGRVVVADVAFMWPGSGVGTTLAHVLAAADCADLEVAGLVGAERVLLGRCHATLRDCDFHQYPANPSLGGSDALVAHQSEVDVVDCRLTGSYGGLRTGIGVRCVDGVLRLRATAAGSTEVRGGGDGLGGQTAALQILRTAVEIDPLGHLGPVVNQYGSVAVRPLPATTASWANGLASAKFFADAGTAALLGFGLARAPVPFVPGAGLRLDLQAGVSNLVAGVVPASRSLSTAALLPNTIWLLGARFVAQGATLAQGQAELANGVALVVR